MKTSKIVMRWALTLAYAGFVFHVLSMATNDRPLPPYVDKLIHVAIFMVMSIMCAWSLRATGLRDMKAMPYIAALISMSYGTAMEAYQIFIPYRDAEFGDAVSNAIGAFLAIPAAWLLLHLRDRWRMTHDRVC